MQNANISTIFRAHRRHQETITYSTDKALVKELDKDISVVMRKRLLEGYSMDVSRFLKFQDRLNY